MPAPNIPQSFHIPSQQSIDMNPYIDAQFEFIGFQPQTEVPNIDMIEGVPIGPPIRRSLQSSGSLLHNTNNKWHIVSIVVVVICHRFNHVIIICNQNLNQLLHQIQMLY